MAYTDIDKPSDYFDTLIYSGNGSNPRTLSGLDFQPNWTWLKNRTDNNGHTLADSVRTANKTLDSSGTGAEITDKNDGHLDAFTSDGFTVGAGSSGDARVNDGSHTYVAWNWKAGTSFTNDASATGIGSIDSAGSVNTDAGFSIVSYTGTGANATVAHGLGSVVKMFFVKELSNANSWEVYHVSEGAGKNAQLNTTAAFESAGSSRWNSTAPTSTTISIGTDSGVNRSSSNYIAYCFSEKKGYSKFGKFIGNGNVNGSFIWTGQKSAFVMIKRTSGTGGWFMFDNKRDTFNLTSRSLQADTSGAENNYTAADTMNLDILSNGFKLKSTDGAVNRSGDSYIYMVFAENPFVTSTGVPATAR